MYLIRTRAFAKNKQKLQKIYSQNLIRSVEMERKRIAGELHDNIGQSLLIIKNKLFLKNEISDLTLVDKAIEEIREISQDIHPYKFEKIGLINSLKNTVETLQKTSNIYFSEEITGEIETQISKEKHIYIFRMIQEAFNNVLKHAKSEACKLKIYADPQFVNIKIIDNGVGFDFASKGDKLHSLGMKTLKERADIIEAQLLIDSVKGKGTTIHIKVPKK